MNNDDGVFNLAEADDRIRVALIDFEQAHKARNEAENRFKSLSAQEQYLGCIVANLLLEKKNSGR